MRYQREVMKPDIARKWNEVVKPDIRCSECGRVGDGTVEGLVWYVTNDLCRKKSARSAVCRLLRCFVVQLKQRGTSVVWIRATSRRRTHAVAMFVNAMIIGRRIFDSSWNS